MGLSGIYKPKTLSQKKFEAEEKTRSALFKTLRYLVWKEAKPRIFWDAKERGVIAPIAPPKRLKDGSWSREEYDPAEIRQLYHEAWREFESEFDQEYINFNSDQLAAEIEKLYGLNKQQALDLNRRRMAEYYGREEI